MTFQESIDQLKELIDIITKEIDIIGENKAAAKRVRKATNLMTKVGKEFRKLSIAHDKT
ncbi:MAG: hypothetical protein U9Q91_00245 [Candidatus Marinimicrobia bacterium]|nr:hypothetical protein [Candidatus Neomarinimicrobiota bacterium]